MCVCVCEENNNNYRRRGHKLETWEEVEDTRVGESRGRVGNDEKTVLIYKALKIK